MSLTESSYSVRKQWAVTTLAAALSYGMLPVLELALTNYRAVARQGCRQFSWRLPLVHATRMGFALSALVIVIVEGLDSPQMQWNGKPNLEKNTASGRQCSTERAFCMRQNKPALTCGPRFYARLVSLLVLKRGKNSELSSPLWFSAGSLSMLYWTFFVFHWGHYFLFVRVQDRMPLFILLWRCKWLASLSRPSTFTGSVPLLAENFTQVVS